MKNSIPVKSLAHKMVRLNGWLRSDAINEIAHWDQVDEKEAERRYDVALQQWINRSVGQYRRQNKIKMAVKSARDLALSIAYHEGAFICSRDLSRVSQEAGWGCLTGFDSTGRAMRDIIDPLEKEGLFIELRTVEDDKFIGYTLTDSGRKVFLAE